LAVIVAFAPFQERDGARVSCAERGRSRDRTRDLLGVSEAL
jgi:hypothetical protein